MKKILKIFLPLAFGIGLLAYFLKGFTAEQLESVRKSVASADLRMLFLSVVLGVLSHVIRALRWEYLLEDFTDRPLKKWNLIFSVGLSYLVNLGIPRSGEVARAVTLSKYEGLPFAKVMGTVLAERVVDLVMLALFIMAGLALEHHLIYDMVQQHFPRIASFRLVILPLIGIAGAAALAAYVQKSQSGIALRIKKFSKDIFTGLGAVLHSPHKLRFLFQTLVIWILYVLMLYVVMLGFDGTKDLPTRAVLTTFIAGSLSIVLSNGGIGTYPVFVTETLLLYGVSKEEGFAFSITMWSAQTLILILFGLFSLLMLPVVNRDREAV